MAHIQKRHSRPGYIARWVDPSGNDKSKSFDRKVDAQNHLTTIQHSKLLGAYADPKLGRTVFSDWVSEYGSSRPIRRPATEARDEWILRSLILPGFGKLPLARIKSLDIQK